MEWVRHHAHQQAFEHFNDATRRVDIGGAYSQRQRGRKNKADHHGGKRGGKGTQQVEEQDRADIGFLALLMVGNGGHDQHQYQQRCHRLQRANEQRAEQANGCCSGWRNQCHHNARYQADQYLLNQAALSDA
ncbi:hypothetical protein D3C80_1752900 [compost metagenome]